MSSWLLVFGLIVAWAAVLVPDLVRRSTASRHSDTIGRFADKMSSLERSAQSRAGRSHGFGRGHGMPRGLGRADNVVNFPSVNRPSQFRPPSTPAVNSSAQRGSAPSRGSARGGSGQPMPMRRSPVQQRRQDVLVSLIAAALLTFLGSVSLGGVFMYVHLVADLALVAYIAALLAVTKRERLRAQAGALYSSVPQSAAVTPLVRPAIQPVYARSAQTHHRHAAH